MAEPWDNSLKTFINENPQDFVSWLLEDAQFKKKLQTEFKTRTIRADGLLEAVQHGKDMLLQIEFQSTNDPTISKLVAAEQQELLPMVELLSSLVFTSGPDKEWILWRFNQMQNILRETWAYQKITQEAREEGREEGKLEGLRRAILKIVQKHFPEMENVTQKQIEGITNPASLEDSLVNISSAQNLQEALQALIALDKGEKKNLCKAKLPTMMPENVC